MRVHQLREELKRTQNELARTQNDLDSCRAAYAHVCAAIVDGPPGGAAAMALMVKLFKHERDEARAALKAAQSP